MTPDPYYWQPRWKMKGAQRVAFEEVRAGLEDYPGICLPCMDTGLPCYHSDERNDHSEAVSFLFWHDDASTADALS